MIAPDFRLCENLQLQVPAKAFVTGNYSKFTNF